jgi:hypothetical protein
LPLAFLLVLFCNVTWDFKKYLEIIDVLKFFIKTEESLPQKFKLEVNSRIRDPSLIEDERLRKEVMNCISCDDNYSPLVEKIR